MKVYEYAPFVVEECIDKIMTQTDLSEMVWGTSGRGNQTLTKSLFPWMAAKKYLNVFKKGRMVGYQATPLGIQMMIAVRVATYAQYLTVYSN
jgi:hypothetical protein